MTDWYVIDSGGNVVNCIASNSRAGAEKVLERMEGGPYTITTHPTPAQLRGYRYWDERP